jgi:hypothetical protein
VAPLYSLLARSCYPTDGCAPESTDLRRIPQLHSGSYFSQWLLRRRCPARHSPGSMQEVTATSDAAERGGGWETTVA